MKALNELIRKNIQAMQPYSSARDEFQGEATVFLDANENPYNHPYNRYPDPLQWELKKMIATYKSVNVESIFLGNGSDEPIDLVIRVFCEPTADNIVSIAPSYGMYEVAAHVNNVEFRKVQLDTNFDVDVDALLQAVNARTKVIFLCSPNNPTGNNLSRERVHRILESFEGIVVVDEAYIDFADTPSFLAELGKFPNLIVLQTFSKAWGAAGVRLGMAFASPEIVDHARKVHDFLTVGAASPLQEAAVVGLRFGDDYYRDLAALYTEKKTLFMKGLDDLRIPHTDPEGAYYVLLDISEFGFESDVVFCEKLAEHVGVGAVPGSSFFREPENPYDAQAIVIKTTDSVKIGYVPRQDNVIFARLMDAGKLLFGKITEKEKKGKWVRISIDIFLHE